MSVSDAAIAQAFREFVAEGYNEIFPCEIEGRARELDAEKGGEAVEGAFVHAGTVYHGDGCYSATFTLQSTPPAQAAEAVEVDALAQFIRTVDGAHTMGAGELAERILTFVNARAAIAAMPAQGDAVDAARYRWLRDECGIVEYKAVAGSVGKGMLPCGTALDYLIDAARSKP